MRALFLFVLLVVAACQPVGVPQLLSVVELTPREAEIGERLELAGAGFPQGRRARVTFRGTLHRPGEAAVAGAEITAEGVVASAQRIEVLFTEELESRFCGAGAERVHTTFEGEVEVAFAAAAPGAPPVAGTLGRVMLDVRPPSPRAGVLAARVAEGNRGLVFMGITAAEAAPAGGLVVTGVLAGSRADEAGVLPGDTLVAFEGLRVHGREDTVVAPGAGFVDLAVRKDGAAGEEARRVRVSGLGAPPARELLGAAIVLLLSAAAIAVLLAPGSNRVAWLSSRIAARLATARRARSGRGAASRGEARRWGVRAAVTLALMAVPLLPRLAERELDLGIVALLAVGAQVGIGLLTGPRGGLRALVLALPGVTALGAVVALTGSLRVTDVVRAQGAWPWAWNAFGSPAGLGLLLLFLAPAVAHGTRAGAPLAEADAQARDGVPDERDEAKVVLTAALAALAFLGGWRLPGVEDAHEVLVAAGAVLFAAKAWSVVALVRLARWALPQVHLETMTALAWRWLLPAALLFAGGAAAQAAWSASRSVQTLVGVATFAMACAAAAHLAARVRHRVRSAGSGLSVNPFL